MRLAGRLIARLAQALLLGVLFGCSGVLAASPLIGEPIALSTHTPQPISQPLAWCQLSQQTAQEPFDAILQACHFTLSSANSLPRGFTDATHILQFAFTNPFDTPIERWLEVGHPRIKQVVLFYQQNGHWHSYQSGIAVAKSERPIIAQGLLLPVRLAAQQTQVYYVAVSADTKIDLTLKLWALPDYFNSQSSLQIVQAIAMGGLMLAALFTLMIYLSTRQTALLWLFASFVCQMLLDASYTGLLATYVWPQDVAYSMGLHGVLVSGTIMFLVLFLRGFLHTSVRYALEDRLLILLLWVLVAISFGFIWQYALPIRALALVVLLVISLSIWVFYRAWRDGSGPAGYLLISYVLLLGLIIYRAAGAFGWVGHFPLQSLGFSWYFLLIAPTTLFAVLKQADDLRARLIRSQTERDAHKYFLAKMSHELRAPLNAILGHAQSLSTHKAVNVGESARVIQAGGRRLLSMIDEILDYSRTQAGTLMLQPDALDLRAFFSDVQRDALEQAQHSASRFVLDLPTALPACVLVDERRLRQVVDNLLSNAFRYGQQGTVTLSLTVPWLGAQRCRLHIAISDTGVGMSAAQQHHIFMPFQRGEQAHLVAREGMGLGLPIANELLHLMGSELQLRSELNQGSCFFFTLECALCADVRVADKMPSAYATRRLARPCYVLLVDDDQTHLQTLTGLLAPLGFHVYTASSARRAQAYLNKPIDAVVSDQFMDDGDGWQVLQTWHRQAQVILLSTAPSQVPPDFAPALRFSRTLLKPVLLEDLLGVLTEVLGLVWQADDTEVLREDKRAIERSDARLAKPDEVLLRRLSELVAQGAVTDLQAWLAQHVAVCQQYPAFFAQFEQALKQLNFTQLKQLIEG